MDGGEVCESALQLPRAKLTSTCGSCGGQICPGEVIYPIEQPHERRSRAGLEWLHHSCARRVGGGIPPPIPVCKHLVRFGMCEYGDKCFFAHSPEIAVAASERVRARLADPNRKIANRGEGRRNRVKNDARASIFRRWLLDTFGVENLRAGSGVLDVAGGKGELSWEFLNLNAVPAVALEPRPLDFASCFGKWKYGIYWRNPIFHRHLHCVCDPQHETQAPLHLRLLLEPQVISWAVEDKTHSACDEQAFSAWTRKAQALAWTRKGLHESHEDQTNQDTVGSAIASAIDEAAVQREAEHYEDDDVEAVNAALGDGELVTSAVRAVSLLRSCSIVAALHPDQAAEHAVSLALALRKPFAVVPCCVYSSEFPRRRLANGSWVRTYEDLLEYLQGMSPGIRRAELGFEGKRSVLFMTADDFAQTRID
eukprot:TRINITY_DN26421_c0_g1_i1.p1 TRINITY_DN26421_c0_g1~~TRINITY_DN26421_c0_g1_i1.p1  ORF type:complete len:424 (-),score=66.52 TRINITY_DN26421_c0_g1_i1:35-1306(-)